MNKDFLASCLAKGMSLPQIGELAGRPPGTVGYWVAKHGLVANGKAKFSHKGPLDRGELEALLDRDLTLKEMASHLNTTIKHVHYWLGKHGLGSTRGGRRTAAIRRARAAGLTEVVLECPKHGVTEFWVGRTSVRCRKCNSQGVADRRRRVKRLLVAEAGGRCRICGYDESLVALEFHHLDPSTKSFGLAGAGISRSIEASRVEAAKCALLCANCHARVEAGELQVAVE